mgnify:CR=1 FL=1
MSQEAIVLFAHGARDPIWALPAQRVAEEVRRLRPGTLVSVAFLELMTPTLAEAVEAAAATLRFVFSQLQVDRIAGRTDAPNAASIRVLQKLGMHPVSEEGMVCYSIDRASVSSPG